MKLKFEWNSREMKLTWKKNNVTLGMQTTLDADVSATVRTDEFRTGSGASPIVVVNADSGIQRQEPFA